MQINKSTAKLHITRFDRKSGFYARKSLENVHDQKR